MIEQNKLHPDSNTREQTERKHKEKSYNSCLIEKLKREKEHLLTLNEKLKNKLKGAKSGNACENNNEIFLETSEKKEIFETVTELGSLIEKIKKNDSVTKQQERKSSELIISLKLKLEQEEKRNEELNGIIEKMREDDEAQVLRQKVSDLNQMITRLETENSKLKYENELLLGEMESYKKQLADALDEVKTAAKKYYPLVDANGEINKEFSDLEVEKCNRVKRKPIDTALLLQHISAAYEDKRESVRKLLVQLNEAEGIIRKFQQQIDSLSI